MRTITGTIETVSGTPAANIEVKFTLVNALNRPISTFVAATYERIFGSFSVYTDANGDFSISLWENTLLVDESYYLVTVGLDTDVPFRAGLETGVGALDWLEFKVAGGSISPADLAILEEYMTRAETAANNAETSETNAAGSATDSQLKAWIAEANQKTADSYATEAEDTFVKVYTSNGDGTFTATDTTEYSALHWRNKTAGLLATKADLNGDALEVFEVADATLDTQAVNKGQLYSEVVTLQEQIDPLTSFNNNELFTLFGGENTIECVGKIKQIISVTTVADVAGSLNNTYFTMYGAGLTGGGLDSTIAEQSVSVWFNVGGLGVQPSAGTDRYIEVAITSDATDNDVALAISVAVNNDVAFNSGVTDGESIVYIVNTTIGTYTSPTNGTSGMTTAVETLGESNFSGANKWVGGVLAPNGKIYGIPFNSTSVLVIDPTTNTATTFGNLSGDTKWSGGVLAPNGKIYGIPANSTSVLVIDPTTNTATTFGSLSGTNKWAGGVLAPNGKIYGIPFGLTSILVIDPATNTATTFGSLSGANKWAGGVLAPNGKIYGIPFSSTSVLVIDPTTNTATTFGNLSGDTKWSGGVLAPNGKIYGIPFNSTSVLVIDPTTNTATTFGNLSGDTKWSGGVLAPNGKIYGIPRDSTSILVIDPATNTATTFGSLSGTSKWYGGVLAPNGKIYGIPFSSTSVLAISSSAESPTNMMLSAYYNKF